MVFLMPGGRAEPEIIESIYTSSLAEWSFHKSLI
jgi:hypothetical protein